MRRAALLALVLLLPACSGSGFGDFLGDTGGVRRNVNVPLGDSETIRRVRGLATDVPPLATEPGNVWPGPTPQEPSLEDLQRQRNTPGFMQQPVPGSPDFRGSGVTPPSTLPGLAAPAVPAPTFPPPASPAPLQGGVVPTQRGPASPTGNGTAKFQQYQGGPANAAGGILIPNGNGTSTLVHPDGTVETVPTPGK